jgi:hypothetical protein
MNHKSKIKSRKLTMVVIILTMILACQSLVYAYPASWLLDVEEVQQEKSRWCWAASSVCCLHYFGVYWATQSLFCGCVFGSTEDRGATVEDIQFGLSCFNYASTVTYSYLTYSTIKSETYTYKRPFIAAWYRPYPLGGHAVVPCGYDDDTTDYVYYMDPGNGAIHESTFTWFKGGTGYDHTWGSSAKNIHHS